MAIIFLYVLKIEACSYIFKAKFHSCFFYNSVPISKNASSFFSRSSSGIFIANWVKYSQFLAFYA
jgi:hypothetical protein